MSLWLIPAAAEQPHVTLTSWAAYEVQLPGLDEPTVHLAGYANVDGGGRVTSPLGSIDALNRSVVSRSGRVYRVIGAPGLSGDAQYVWNNWLRIWDATVLRDMTETLSEQFTASAAAVTDPGLTKVAPSRPEDPDA